MPPLAGTGGRVQTDAKTSEANPSRGLNFAARRVPLLLERFMSAFAKTKADEVLGAWGKSGNRDELKEHRTEVLKVRARKCSSCSAEGHDKRKCPKLIATGMQPPAKARGAVR